MILGPTHHRVLLRLHACVGYIDDRGGIRHAMHDNPIDSLDMRSDNDDWDSRSRIAGAKEHSFVGALGVDDGLFKGRLLPSISLSILSITPYLSLLSKNQVKEKSLSIKLQNGCHRTCYPLQDPQQRRPSACPWTVQGPGQVRHQGEATFMIPGNNLSANDGVFELV